MKLTIRDFLLLRDVFSPGRNWMRVSFAGPPYSRSSRHSLAPNIFFFRETVETEGEESGGEVVVQLAENRIVSRSL